MRVLYGKLVAKSVEKHRLPENVWDDFRDSFEALAQSRNFRLFDIKKLQGKGAKTYYRMRIRDYRALFRMDGDLIYVEDIGPRGRIYKS